MNWHLSVIVNNKDTEMRFIDKEKIIPKSKANSYLPKIET